MAFRLIPKEEKFYDDFTAMSEQIRHGAQLLVAMLAPLGPPLIGALLRMPSEHAGGWTATTRSRFPVAPRATTWKR